jgi:hypothetical protein
MKPSSMIFTLLITCFCLLAPRGIYCQTETLDIVRFNPPKGWTKAQKEGAVVYTDVNKATNTFCILTVYGASTSSGDPQRDFADKWKELVVTPFKGDAIPKTETQTTPDGWKATAGGSQIQMEGFTPLAILTVFSGFDKTVSILTIFNDQLYVAQMQAFIDGISLDRALTRSRTSEPMVKSDSLTTIPIEHWSILREFQDNQVAAEMKYNGKRVTIAGDMDFVLVENGKPVVRMSVPAWSGRQMFCIFPVSQKTAVAQLSANQRIVMECTVEGNVGGVSRLGRVDLGSSVGRITLDNCALR